MDTEYGFAVYLEILECSVLIRGFLAGMLFQQV